jgi:tetratricopeptide (TPR) repeat protein
MAQAQFGAPGERRGFERGFVSGRVLFENDSTPVPMSRVEVRSTGNGAIVSTFTDSEGNFQASGVSTSSYVIEVQAPGCEPVEQVVTGENPNMIVYVKKNPVAKPPEGGNSVSAHELSIPEKARDEYQKGLEQLAKKDPASGLAHFQKATKKSPSFYEAYYEMGVAKVELNHIDEAEQDFQKSIDLSGGHYAVPHFALGAVLCDKKEYADAERVAQRGLDVDANSPEGYVILGQALLGQKKTDEAEKNAREAVSRKHDLPIAYLLLANIHLAKRDEASVVRDLDEYLKLEPNGRMSAQARQVRDSAQQEIAKAESSPVIE